MNHHDQAVEENQNLRGRSQRTEGDHGHMVRGEQGQNRADIEHGAHNGGIVGVFGKTHGRQGREAQNIAGQNDHHHGEHDAEHIGAVRKLRAEEPRAQGAGENAHHDAAEDDQGHQQRQRLFHQLEIPVFHHVGIHTVGDRGHAAFGRGNQLIGGGVITCDRAGAADDVQHHRIGGRIDRGGDTGKEERHGIPQHLPHRPEGHTAEGDAHFALQMQIHTGKGHAVADDIQHRDQPVLRRILQQHKDHHGEKGLDAHGAHRDHFHLLQATVEIIRHQGAEENGEEKQEIEARVIAPDGDDLTQTQQHQRTGQRQQKLRQCDRREQAGQIGLILLMQCHIRRAGKDKAKVDHILKIDHGSSGSAHQTENHRSQNTGLIGHDDETEKVGGKLQDIQHQRVLQQHAPFSVHFVA